MLSSKPIGKKNENLAISLVLENMDLIKHHFHRMFVGLIFGQEGPLRIRLRIKCWYLM